MDISIIDVGMILTMEPADREKFTKFVLSIVSKKPLVCAEMIYNLSMYRGEKISNLPTTKKL